MESMYQAAIAEVLEQHADASSKPRTPPYFKMPNDFMRSFIPGTGVGNREGMYINISCNSSNCLIECSRFSIVFSNLEVFGLVCSKKI